MTDRQNKIVIELHRTPSDSVARDDYRGWQIEHNPPAIPCRDFDWTATHPDFDGPEDGRQVWGRTIADVITEIDGWYEDNGNG